jgi:hypothetical protein
MKYCDSCNGAYAEDFTFCPLDGQALRSATECANQHGISAPVGFVGQSNLRIRRWVPVVVAVVIATVAVWVFTSSRAVQPNALVDQRPPVTDGTKIKTKQIVRPPSVSFRRPVRTKGVEKPDESLDRADGLAQQVRVQQLVASGYRYLQQRDYGSARDAFEGALEIDPHSIPAQKGLNAAKTGESVEGVAQVFRR